MSVSAHDTNDLDASSALCAPAPSNVVRGLNYFVAFPSPIGHSEEARLLPCTGSSMVRQLTGNHIDKSMRRTGLRRPFLLSKIVPFSLKVKWLEYYQFVAGPYPYCTKGVMHELESVGKTRMGIY